MIADKRPARIKISDEIFKQIEKHSYSNLEAEVGGMLFGTVSGGKTNIVGFVPALKAETNQATLTFTHDVWEEILKEGEKKFPGKQIVGWYHTHPSFGIFLSDYDQFIQNNFFNNAGQVALVIDPIAGELGWFEKKGNDIPLLSKEKTALGPKKARKAPKGDAKFNSALVISTIATAVVSVTATLAVTMATRPVDSSAQLQQAIIEIQSLQGMLDAYQNVVTMQYLTQEGDTPESIASMFYGDDVGVDQLKADNPKVDFNNLKPNTVLTITTALGADIAPDQK